MGVDELLKDKRQQILSLADQYGAYNVRVFGSVARGEARPDSDVDLLVEFNPEADVAAELMDLWAELEHLLGRAVDLIPEDCLRESLRARVLREAVPL